MQLVSIPGFNDPLSSFSHLLVGAPIFLALTRVYWAQSKGHPDRQLTLLLYGLANVVLFTLSGVYHLLGSGTAERMVLQRLDHAAIFVLIAGTFTPAHWILFRGWKRWLPLTVVWIAAIAGIVLKSIYFDDVSESLGLLLYLSLGWLGALSGFLIWYHYGGKLFTILLAAAASYTCGAILDYLRWPIIIPGVWGHHECFHLAVLAGAGFFGYFMYRIAPGTYPPICRDEVVEPVWS
jgi:channel protein (hemolysin III family)